MASGKDLFRVALERRVGVGPPVQSLFREALECGNSFGRDWEMEEACVFLDMLYRQKDIGKRCDDILWVPLTHGRYGVRSMFFCLSNFIGHDFPWKSIWCSKAPLRIAFFVWTATLGKILTLDNLRKRGNTIVNWCCQCKADGESVDHILMHCLVAYDCWNFIFSMFGVYWIMPKHSLQLINAWK
ncbi:uncharacterized protein LOC132271881 [Cornus florida]|uniref:uncharacterized protein LOC132271881 n=1 Tax=Cornus florida TaxID=4283 RepID=UPI0028989458|nr:uncharacterized protein LOC132271881 [Cornus florida]